MNRSSIPADRRARITSFMRVRFWAMASAAVVASVMTPKLMLAMSGAARTSPWADRFRVGVSGWTRMVWLAGGACWARGGGGGHDRAGGQHGGAQHQGQVRAGPGHGDGAGGKTGHDVSFGASCCASGGSVRPSRGRTLAFCI